MKPMQLIFSFARRYKKRIPICPFSGTRRGRGRSIVGDQSAAAFQASKAPVGLFCIVDRWDLLGAMPAADRLETAQPARESPHGRASGEEALVY